MSQVGSRGDRLFSASETVQRDDDRREHRGRFECLLVERRRVDIDPRAVPPGERVQLVRRAQRLKRLLVGREPRDRRERCADVVGDEPVRRDQPRELGELRVVGETPCPNEEPRFLQ